MKQFLVSVLMILSTAYAHATPLTQGDVTFKDELVIINKNIVCSAYSIPDENPSHENVIYGEYTHVSQEGNKINISGRLNGDLFSIGGTVNELISVRIQEGDKAGHPTYVFSTSGRFSDFTHKNTRVQNVGLSALINGRRVEIGCSLR